MAETDEVSIPVRVEGAEEAMRQLDKAQEKTEETRRSAEQGGGALGGAGVGAAVGGFAGASIGTVAAQTGIGQVAGGFLEAAVGKLIVTFQDEIRKVVSVLGDIKDALGPAVEAAGDALGEARTVVGQQLTPPGQREELTSLGDVAKTTTAFAGAGTLLGAPFGPQAAAAGGLAGGVTGLTVSGFNFANDRLGLIGEGVQPNRLAPQGQGVQDEFRINETFTRNTSPNISDPDVLPGSGGAARNATSPTTGVT